MLIQYLPKNPKAIMIFFGGAGDWCSRFVESYVLNAVSPKTPFLFGEDTAILYGEWCDRSAVETVYEDYVKQNRTKAPAAVIGHSWGGSTAYDCQVSNRQILVTIDPVSRFAGLLTRRFPTWVNVYCTQTRSRNDFIAFFGGQWGKCEYATENKPTKFDHADFESMFPLALPYVKSAIKI